MLQRAIHIPIDKPDEEAEKYMDKLFPSFSFPEEFDISSIIIASDFSDLDKQKAHQLSDNIRELILNVFHYADITHYIYLRLNQKGIAAKAAGGHFTYQQQSRNKDNFNQTNNFHIGDNYGTVVNAGHQSSLSLNQDQSREKQKQTNINPTKPPKRSVLEILSWIVGISAGLVAIYEFIIKKFILKQ